MSQTGYETKEIKGFTIISVYAEHVSTGTDCFEFFSTKEDAEDRRDEIIENAGSADDYDLEVIPATITIKVNKPLVY